MTATLIAMMLRPFAADRCWKCCAASRFPVRFEWYRKSANQAKNIACFAYFGKLR
jgi:hypothetical protein